LSSSSKSDDENDRNYDTIETICGYSEIQNDVIDVRSAQRLQETTNSASSFPNPAYETFVQLVTKHKLSDSVVNNIIHLFNNFRMDPAELQFYHQMRKQHEYFLIQYKSLIFFTKKQL
jgi:hypothetical protein